MEKEKTFVSSKKALAFAFALIVIAASCLIGFKIGMPQEMVSDMTGKIMMVALSLILGQSGIDIAKKIMEVMKLGKGSTGTEKLPQ